jgi:hypothetical protein
MKKIIFLFLFVGLSAIAQENPNNGFMPSRVTTTERDAFTNPAKGLIIFNTTTNSLQINNGTGAAPTWESIATSASSATYGDVKTGIQAADHSGWIKLDGRLKSSLTATQQTQATALGIGTNLPNATNSVLMQNGTALGSVSGSNTKNIAQNNLPNVTLSGTTNSNGDHAHNYTNPLYGGSYTGMTWDNSGTAVEYPQPNGGTTTTNGAHTHTFTTSSINGGVAQQAFDVTPKSMSVNTFLFLGN